MPRRKKAPAVMHRNAIPPLLLFTALLTACAPEEKTMQLPLVSSAEDETQANPSDRDFTVKKIYTYSYETLELLDKSAFLSGSGENEVHILSAAGENEANGIPSVGEAIPWGNGSRLFCMRTAMSIPEASGEAFPQAADG